MDIQEFELKVKYSLILDLSLQANDTPELQLEKNLHPTKYHKACQHFIIRKNINQKGGLLEDLGEHLPNYWKPWKQPLYGVESWWTQF